MVTIDQVLSAKNWGALGVSKTKDVLRDLQRQFHPDANSDPRSNDAFAKIMSLFEGPDYSLRVASGTSVPVHHIIWNPTSGFEDRIAVGDNALGMLSGLEDKYSMFFPKVYDRGPDHVRVEYGEGWWFLEDFGVLDSRTAVWVAKRISAAIKKSSELGIIHGDINPKTVVLKPSEHGLMLDGWWHAVSKGKKLALKPDAPTPAKYFGGAEADEKLAVAQAAAMLRDRSKCDKLLADEFKRYSLGVGNVKEFFKAIDDTAKKLYGPPSWHPLNNPSVQMI